MADTWEPEKTYSRESLDEIARRLLEQTLRPEQRRPLLAHHAPPYGYSVSGEWQGGRQMLFFHYPTPRGSVISITLSVLRVQAILA